MNNQAQPTSRCVMEVLEQKVMLSGGDPDGTFGTGGIVILPKIPANSMLSAARQINGKLVVATSPAPGGRSATLVRYLPTGTVDLSFGQKGQVKLKGTEALPMFVCRDGSIITAQQVGSNRWAVIRLTNKGRYDRSFGNGGIAVAAPDKIVGIVRWMSRIYVIRYRSGFSVERYLLNGRLDRAFGGTGVVRTPLPFDAGSKSFCESIAVQKDGKPIVAGNANEHFALVRYTRTGQLDTTFNGTGKVITDLPASSEAITQVFALSDGKILAQGRNMGDYGYTFALARYLPDGQLDESFGTGGMVDTPVGAFRPGVLQSDGKLVIAGGPDGDILMARYDTTGALDQTFGHDAMLQVDYNGGADDPRAIFALGARDKVLLVTRSVLDGRGRAVVERFLSA